MTIDELIENHAQKCLDGGGFLKSIGEFRSESSNHLSREWMRYSINKFAIELLEMVEDNAKELSKDAGDKNHYRDSEHRSTALFLVIKALEELRK